MWARKTLVIAIALLVGGVLGSSVAEAGHPDRLSCVPSSTCGDPAISADAADCRPGEACVCVPSCPLCDDCATQVCVPVEIACHSACDCPDGMGCERGYCSADAELTYCCEDERCPAGEKCQNPNGEIDVCQRECRTACDCEPGLGCFDGECIAGIAPVYCCEGDVCPTDQQCQHETGRTDRCENDDPMCRKRLQTSQRRIRRVVEKTRPCRADDECAAIDPATGCQGACPAYVNRRYADRVQNFINYIDERYCTGYQEAGCPFSTPSCQETVGRCVRGQCTAVEAPRPNPLPVEPVPVGPSTR